MTKRPILFLYVFLLAWTFPSGAQVDAFFAPRGAPPPPPDAPWTWTAVWNVPADYPLGVLPYSILLKTADGKSATLKPTDFAGMPLQIVD